MVYTSRQINNLNSGYLWSWEFHENNIVLHVSCKSFKDPTYRPILAVCIYICTCAQCIACSSLLFSPGVWNTDLILQDLFTLNLTHTHLKKTSAVIVQSLYRLNNAPQTALSLGFPLTWLPLYGVKDCLTPSSLCLSLFSFKPCQNALELL